MNWKALILLVMAPLLYAPFAGGSSCGGPSCCAQMMACCGHCHCPAGQTCSVAKPATLDQQAPLKVAQVSPRIEVALYPLTLSRLLTLESERCRFSWQPETPPPKALQPAQARLCLWLI